MDELTDIDKYVDEWTRTQLLIWREKIERMGIVRSGALHQSFSEAVQHATSQSASTTITMKFLHYGIYQALGVGRGYAHDNGGDLLFLNKDYRKAHRLDKPRMVGPAWGGYNTSGHPREPRDWFSKKLYASTINMVNDLARILGEESAHVICENLNDMRSTLKH